MKSYPGIDTRTGWWIAILLFLGTVSCGGQPSPGEELRVLIEADPAHLDPRLGSDQASLRIHQLLYNGLVTIDEFGLPAPDLAESWEREDDRTYLFHLRPGLRFHDGRPVTARDVAYTIESIREGEVASFRKGDFEQLEAVQVVDPRTIRFRLRQPFSPFLTVLTVGIIPENRSGEIAVESVGTGPYRLVEYRRDDRLVLAANSDYFRGVPAIPRVQFRIVPDQTSRLLELRKGSADLVYGDLFPDQIGWLQKDSRYRVITGQSWKYDYIGFNLEDPILGNPLVRKAIAHGIDRESIRTHLLQGYARLATGMLQADHWAYESQVNRYDHDIRRAAELLDQAGFPDPDGAGPEPRFRVTYKTSNSEFARRKAAVFQEQLRRIGIQMEIRTYEWATFYEDIRAGRFQLFSLTWTGVVDPDIYRFRFHSRMIPPDGANRGRYRNPEIDGLLEEGLRETDRARRTEVYSRVQKILATDVAEISLWHRDEIAVLKAELVGFRLTPMGDYRVIAELRWERE